MENRKKFLDDLALKLNITSASEWGKVSHKQFCDMRGVGILKYYNGSPFHCLQSVYKGLYFM